jgi:xylono-1,5-lactonase
MNKLACVWDAKAELGEGPVWHQEEQALYWVDIIQSNLHRFRFDREGNQYQHSWHFAGQLSSVVPAKRGGLLATFDTGIFHISLNTQKKTPIQLIEQEIINNRFNDGCCDTQGNYWFGSMDNNQASETGSFYRLNNNGKLNNLLELGQCTITNGPTFSQDGKYIYFTNTLAKTISQGCLDQDNNITNVQPFVQFSDNDGHPDGMCLDAEGFLWVCHYGVGKVSRFNQQGNCVRTIDLPVPNVTKCCFGGKTLNTLFITTAINGMSKEQQADYPLSGGLFSIDIEQQGFVYPACALSR